MIDKQFTELINKNKPLIHHVCETYCKAYDRDDLVQDILLNAWRTFINFKHNSKFSTWLYSVAMNTALYTARKLKKQPKVLPLGGGDVPGGVGVFGDKELEQKIKQAEIYCCVLASLPPHERNVFELYLEGVSYTEIEQQTGINQNLLRVRINRIKKRLQLRYGK